MEGRDAAVGTGWAKDVKERKEFDGHEAGVMAMVLADLYHKMPDACDSLKDFDTLISISSSSVGGGSSSDGPIMATAEDFEMLQELSCGEWVMGGGDAIIWTNNKSISGQNLFAEFGFASYLDALSASQFKSGSSPNQTYLFSWPVVHVQTLVFIVCGR